MGLQDKLKRLEKSLRGKLGHIELSDGTRYWFDPEEHQKEIWGRGQAGPGPPRDRCLRHGAHEPS
jgi:hypothetical protein